MLKVPILWPHPSVPTGFIIPSQAGNQTKLELLITALNINPSEVFTVLVQSVSKM